MIAMGMGLGLQSSNFIAQQVLNYQNRVIADGGELLLTQEEIMALMPLGDWSWFYVPSGRKAGTSYAQIPGSAGDLSVTRASVANENARNGLLSEVAANVGRLDFLNGAFLGQPIEPAATNLLTNSEGDLSTYTTTAGNVSNASGSILSFANSIQFGNNSAQTAAYKRTFTPTSGVTYTLSAFVQMDDNSVPVVGTTASTGDFSLILNNNRGLSPIIERVGNSNVYKVSATFTAIDASTQFGVIKYTGQSAKGFRFSGIQLETGTRATSYIPTAASAVTRNADVISLTGASGLIGHTQGTIYVEVDLRSIPNRRIFTLSDGTLSNDIRINIDSGNFLQFAVLNGSAVQANIFTSYTPGILKIACAYNLNDFAMYLNGTLVGTDLSGTVPAVSQINIGSNGTASAHLNDRIRAAGISQRRWTNAELAQLTSL